MSNIPKIKANELIDFIYSNEEDKIILANEVIRNLKENGEFTLNVDDIRVGYIPLNRCEGYPVHEKGETKENPIPGEDYLVIK